MAGFNYCRKKPILTACWKCFFDLILVAFVIIIHNGLSQRILPLCLTVTKLPLFRTLSTCRWQERRNQQIPCLRLAILGDIRKIKSLFTFPPHIPHLCSITEHGIQT